MNATSRFRYRIAAVAGVIAMTPMAAFGQTPWARLPSPATGLTLQVDTTSIMTIGDSTFGSFRWTGLYPSDTTDNGIKYAYVERDRIATCRTGTIAVEAISFYAANDTIIDGTFWEAHEWQFTDVRNGSTSAVERDVLCSFARRRAERGRFGSAPRQFIVRPSVIAPQSHEATVLPMFAGFRIGQPLRIAKPLVGLPLRVDTLGSGSARVVSLSNSKTGITLLATSSDGVGVILATVRDAGALDGVRVGDLRSAALARWGPPAAGTDESGLWLAGRWVITASFDAAGRITRIGIGQ